MMQHLEGPIHPGAKVPQGCRSAAPRESMYCSTTTAQSSLPDSAVGAEQAQQELLICAKDLQGPDHPDVLLKQIGRPAGFGSSHRKGFPLIL